jgi:hypothetical protein
MTRTLTPNRGAQAQADYAWRAREQHRRTVRQIWNSGIKTHAAVAAELNRLAVPSEDGRPWGVTAAGRLLRQFGLGRVILGREHAEAIREDVIELWGMGVQVPRQLAVALDRKGVPCPGGVRWTEHRAGRVMELLDGDWREDFGNVRLRRGDTIPEAYVIEVDEAAELGPVIEPEAVAAAPVEPIEVQAPADLEPQEPRPRRRAIRI